MNLFGKILIMLNLLMSLVFMGFATAVYSTHKNWKEMVTLDKAAAAAKGKPVGLQTQLADLRTERDALETKYLALQKEVKQELAMRNARLQVLETERENLVQQVDVKSKEIEQITQDKNVTSAAIEKLTLEAGKKSAEIEALSTDIDSKRGEIQKIYDDYLTLTDRLAKTQAELDKANTQAKVLVASNADLKAALKRLGYDSTSIASRIAAPPPKVDGVVRASTPEGLVEISLGSDDGLMRGHTLEVYREGATPNATKYLGRIQILSTKADVAVGQVLPQYRRGNIEKDDRVATRFN
jgi:hypothetical protein